MKLGSIPKPNTQAPFFWFVVLCTLLFVYLFGFTAWALVKYGKIYKEPGFEIRNYGSEWKIDHVFSNGPAFGILEAGDTIIAINGDESARRTAPLILDSFPQEQESYTMRVERDGKALDLALSIPLSVGYKNLLRILAPLPSTICFVVVGLLIGAIKAEERYAQLASLAFLLVALTTIDDLLQPISHSLQGSSRTLYLLTGVFFPAQFVLAYHFYYSFPPETPKSRFWSFLKYFFYASGAIVFLFVNARSAFYYFDRIRAFNFFLDHPQYQSIYVYLMSYFETIAVIAIFAVIIRNYVVNKEPDQRRRSRLLMYSSVASFFMLILSNVTFDVGYLNPFGFSSYALDWITSVVIILIPISVGYSILKHKMFDINIIIRRTLQYLLAKNGLRFLLSIPLLGLIFTILSSPNRTLTDILFRNSVYFYVLVVVALLISLVFRQRLVDWIDRRFFRTAYKQEQVLLKLIDKVKVLDSIPKVAEAVSIELEDVFHPKSIHIFYREKEEQDLVLGYSSGESVPNLSIPSDFRLLRFMEDMGSSQEFPFPPKNRLPQHEKDWLASLDVNLIIPMNGADERLAGLLLLGEKKSEVDYSQNDRKLLEGLAGQMAMVYENMQLKRHVHEGRKIEREVLAHFAEASINLVKECPSCGLCYDSEAETCTNDGNGLELSLPVERTIDGKYQLDKLLGKGGMGAVYVATDLRFKRQVAVKLMLGNLFGDPMAIRRFKREAFACAKLSHPNIIAVYDYGSLSTKNSEGAYMVMELAKGTTLRTELRRNHLLRPSIAADWFDQILEGIKAAHHAGIIHRDLKPENIHIASHDSNPTCVKILDFGLAKVLNQSGATETAHISITAPGSVMGTYAYMSPEQVEGKKVDERSDLFAIGVMIVESLTGRRPFSGTSVTQLAKSILLDDFHLTGDVLEIKRLDDILQKCLAKNANDRFASAEEMQKEIIMAIRSYPLDEELNPTVIDSEVSTFEKNRN